MKKNDFDKMVYRVILPVLFLIPMLSLGSCVQPDTSPTLESILVTKLPDKTTYIAGETFNPAGLEVTGPYSDNTTKLETGYILSAVNTAVAGTKTVKVSLNGKTDTFEITVVASTYTYGITLDVTGTHTFPETVTGYGVQTAKGVTITNTLNQATGALTVALSGTNSGSFTLSTATVASIAADRSGTFTVAPNTGLELGTYTAVVTVSGGNGIMAGFVVSFTVTSASITKAILPGTWEKTPPSNGSMPFASATFTVTSDFEFTYLGLWNATDFGGLYSTASDPFVNVTGSFVDQGGNRYRTSLTLLLVQTVIGMPTGLTGAAAAEFDGVVFTVTKGADNNHITITVDQSDGSTAATNEAMVMDGTYTRVGY
ncbi:hypothetical protein AGMMS49991_01280 [Spirochaetia bacterium]|nr:hypothetical protein AGMMS49991_01280 [Spirochaetia bacterium]